jgi:hypothetical protein
MNCPHRPPCPAADRSDREAARVVAAHPEQGWSLLCNGVVTFDDTGDLLPGGHIVAPHRALPVPRSRSREAASPAPAAGLGHASRFATVAAAVGSAA